LKTIWKFKIDPTNPNIEMPLGSRVLSVGVQHSILSNFDEIFIWAEVDPKAAMVTRYFVGTGTGHNVPEPPCSYCGTVLLDDGNIVIHVYEVLR
jgi:hypothetical protein